MKKHQIILTGLSMLPLLATAAPAGTPHQAIIPGKIVSTIVVNERGDVPRLTITLTSNKAPIKTLIQSFNGKSSIRGKISMHLQLTTQGSSMKSWLSHLKGHGYFNITNGALEHIKISRSVQQVLGFIGDNKPITNSKHEIPFSSLRGTLKVVHGVIKNKDLSMISKRLNANGKGTINLVNDELEFNLVTKDKKVKIPIIIKGKITSPKVKINSKKLGKLLFKKKLSNFFK